MGLTSSQSLPSNTDRLFWLSVAAGLAVTGFMFELDTQDNTALAPLVDAFANIETPDTKFTMDGTSFKVID